MNAREVNGSEYSLSILGPARRIEWEGDFPADLRAIVEPLFTPLEVLLPTWCQTVVLRYVPHDTSTLKIELSIRNRWALIRICPSWFTESAVERQDAFIHEMCHALLEPFQWSVTRALNDYGPPADEPGHAYLHQSIDDALEQAVEDTARAFQKLLPPP